MSRPHSIIVHVDAGTAANNMKFHCHHPSGGRTYQLGQTDEVITYLYCDDPRRLTQLANALIEQAFVWHADIEAKK